MSLFNGGHCLCLLINSPLKGYGGANECSVGGCCFIYLGSVWMYGLSRDTGADSGFRVE